MGDGEGTEATGQSLPRSFPLSCPSLPFSEYCVRTHTHTHSEHVKMNLVMCVVRGGVSVCVCVRMTESEQGRHEGCLLKGAGRHPLPPGVVLCPLSPSVPPEPLAQDYAAGERFLASSFEQSQQEASKGGLEAHVGSEEIQ